MIIWLRARLAKRREYCVILMICYRLDVARVDRECLQGFFRAPSQPLLLVGKFSHIIQAMFSRTHISLSSHATLYLCLYSVYIVAHTLTHTHTPTPTHTHTHALTHTLTHTHTHTHTRTLTTAFLLVFLALVLSVSVVAIVERISLYPLLPSLW